MLPVTTVMVDRMSRQYPNASFRLAVESKHILLRDLRERALELVISRMLAPAMDDDLCMDSHFPYDWQSSRGPTTRGQSASP